MDRNICPVKSSFRLSPRLETQIPPVPDTKPRICMWWLGWFLIATQLSSRTMMLLGRFSSKKKRICRYWEPSCRRMRKCGEARGEECRRAGLFRLMLCRWAGRRGHMELLYSPARRYCAHLPLCQLNQQREFHLGVQWGPINLNLASN